MSKAEWIDMFGEVLVVLERKKDQRKAKIMIDAIAEATAKWDKEKILIQAEIDGMTSVRDELIKEQKEIAAEKPPFDVEIMSGEVDKDAVGP